MKQTVKHIIISVIILALTISFASCAWLDIGGTTTTTKPTTTEPAHTCEFGEWVVETEPTHKEVGSRYQLCECGKENREEIPVIPHEYTNDWRVVEEPTHTAEGLQIRTCECGAYETEVLPALDHETRYVRDYESNIPCLPSGEVWYCVECDCEFDKVTVPPVSDHVKDESSKLVRTEPTCQEEGTVTYRCRYCWERVFEESIPKVECSVGEWVEIKAPTCTAEGSLGGYCVHGCGKVVETKAIPVVECEFGEWTQSKAPACTSDGLMERSCVYGCGNKETEVIKGGHEEVYTPNHSEKLVTVTCSKCSETIKTIPFAEGLTYELAADGSGYLVTGKGTHNSTEVVIPNEYEGKPVVGIAQDAFWNSDLTYLGVFTTNELMFTFYNYALDSSTNLKRVDVIAGGVTLGLQSLQNCGEKLELHLSINEKDLIVVESEGDYDIPFYYNTHITIHFADKTVEYNGLENE